MMKRIGLIIAGLLCLSAATFAQGSVPSGTALDAALADVNAKLGTSYTLNGGQLTYYYEEDRVTGDSLGCPGIADTNQNSYMQMTTRFDFNFDDVFEWEHRFAYEADGTLKMVVCQQPGAGAASVTAVPTTEAPTSEAPVVDVTATTAPAATVIPGVTPAGTENLEPIYGRDGARLLLPASCGGADNALPNRLVSGSMGRVTPGGATNNLRQSPDVNSPRLGEIAAGALFKVMDGPFCSGDIAWYLIGDGTTPIGWTAEGRNGEYFLQPLLTDAAPIVPENVLNLTNYGGIFAPDTRAFSANAPDGTLLVSNGETLQRWLPQGGFTTLDTLTWEVGEEFATPHQWVFADNVGRQWGADVTDGGSLTLVALNDETLSPYSQLVSGRVPVVSVDDESNFAAVADGDTVTLVGLTRDGTEAEVIAELPQDSAVTDVLFDHASMTLFVATGTQVNVYKYELGEGWQTTAALSIPHTVTGGLLAVDESGDRLAISGTSADDAGVIMLYSGLNSQTAVTSQFSLEDGVTIGKPAFNSRGTLGAVYASDNTVRLFGTDGQPVGSIAVGTEQSLGTGGVAFSRDGLVLWVVSDGAGVQPFAVAQ